MNDLWAFNTSSEKWKFISGSQSSNDNGVNPGYIGGTGLPASRRASACWTSSEGELFMFGGILLYSKFERWKVFTNT